MYENYSVLFVDDEVNILSSLKRGLINEEYLCYFASNGKEALKILEKNKISVIVTDMRMPEMDGLTLLKEVSTKWPQTVRIVLSGYTQLQQILTTINQVDIFKFITKPWKLEEEFKHVIYKALDYYKIIEENELSKVALNKKNQAYQNILKNIENTIANAKKSSEILSSCGKSILLFSRKQKYFDYSKITNLREYIFEVYSKAVLSDETEVQAIKIVNKILESANLKIKNIKSENKVEDNYKIKVNFSILEATINSCIEAFKEEYSSMGLNLFFIISEKKSFVVTFMCRIIDNVDNMDIDAIYEKINFVNNVLVDTLRITKMSFSTKFTNSTIISVVSVDVCE